MSQKSMKNPKFREKTQTKQNNQSELIMTRKKFHDVENKERFVLVIIFCLFQFVFQMYRAVVQLGYYNVSRIRREILHWSSCQIETKVVWIMLRHGELFESAESKSVDYERREWNVGNSKAALSPITASFAGRTDLWYKSFMMH